MPLTQMLVILASSLFSLSVAAFLAGWIRTANWDRAAHYFIDLGFLVLCVILFIEAMELGVYVPVANTFQVLVFSAWSVLLMFLFVRRGIAQSSFSLFLMPLVIGVLLLALGQDSSRMMIPKEYVTDQLFAVHTLTGFFAYANFALSFVASLLYLLESWVLKRKAGGKFYQRIPPLELLEHMVYVSVALGVPLLATTLITGFYWSKSTFGQYWLWDVKVVFATFTWLLYLGLLYLRFVRSLRGTRVMVYSLVSFSLVIATLVGGSLIQEQVHSVL